LSFELKNRNRTTKIQIISGVCLFILVENPDMLKQSLNKKNQI